MTLLVEVIKFYPLMGLMTAAGWVAAFGVWSSASANDRTAVALLAAIIWPFTLPMLLMAHLRPFEFFELLYRWADRLEKLERKLERMRQERRKDKGK
jgi:hypothetical protein